MSRPELSDTVALRAWRDQSLYRLLLRSARMETTTTLERIHARGFDDLTITDTNLMANLDTTGASITALAQRAGITRQAAGQQVTSLETRGYLQRRPDPNDARAAIIVQTDRGLALLEAAFDIVEALESDYATLLGATEFDELKRLLTSLLDTFDPIGGLTDRP
jgi:DNA-binding MarR family transcriptional regulator